MRGSRAPGSFEEFDAVYLAEHARPLTRWLRFAGTAPAIVSFAVRALATLAVSTALISCRAPVSTRGPGDIVATYSIVASDPETGDLGVAVQSRFFGVGTVVPWARAGVGAIATQALANIAYGSEGLKLLESGLPPQEVIGHLTGADDDHASRQCGIVDAKGRSAAFTGSKCIGFASHRTAKNVSVQGNILAGPGVLDAMMRAFAASREEPRSELADWLVAALQAGEDAGGDRRGRQSAALLVVRDRAGYGGASDRYIDLRVEDDPNPTLELARLLGIHKRFHAEKHAAKPAIR